MKPSRLHGIILKRANIGEADRIITVFSLESGKICLVAKGIRRISSRRAPHLELFNEVDLTIHSGKVWDLITEAKKNSGPKVPSGYLFYLTEILDKILPEHVAHREIYEKLCETMANPSEKSVKNFIIECLWDLGYLPVGQYPKTSVTDFVENIVERPIKSRKFVDKI